MKTKFYFICFSLIFVSCNQDFNEFSPYFLDCLECMNMPRPDDSYNYQVYPGTEKWNSLSSGEEKVDACQIPISNVKKMSTQALIQAIWEHPLLWFVLHRFQYQLDFESLFAENKAFMELEKRKDAGEQLLCRYELVCPVSPVSARCESQLLEILISQPVFLSQLNDDSKRKIVEIAFLKDDLRQNEPELPKNSIVFFNRSTTWLLIGRTLFYANYTPFLETVNGNSEFKAFIEGRNPPKDPLSPNIATWVSYNSPQYDDIIQDIINFGNKFLNK